MNDDEHGLVQHCFEDIDSAAGALRLRSALSVHDHDAYVDAAVSAVRGDACGGNAVSAVRRRDDCGG